MTQPPTHPTPPAGGPAPTPGGFAPPSGPPGYAVPPQYAPPPGWAPPPGYVAGPPRPAAPPPTLTPGGQPLASFADRLLAALIDVAVFTAVGMVLAVPAMIVFFIVVLPDLQVVAGGTVPEPDFVNDFLVPFLWLELAVIAISLVLAYVYYVEMMFRTGQTFGKKTMKLRVVPLDPTRTLDRRAAVRRFLVQNLVGLVLPGFSYLDGLWQLWDKPWQQCLHDKFARTVVVKVSA